MARPRVTEARREEILEAFARCVARDGVEGASLQKVADEAGLARALLRHHIGNREELVLALAERFCHRSLAEMADLVAALPEKKRLETFITALFAPGYASSAEDLKVGAALVNAAESRPELRGRLRAWYEAFEKIVAEELGRAYPKAKRGPRAEVATGIVGMAFSADSLSPLGDAKALFTRSRRAALRLAATLGN